MVPADTESAADAQAANTANVGRTGKRVENIVEPGRR
jgi:hypothetical protein